MKKLIKLFSICFIMLFCVGVFAFIPAESFEAYASKEENTGDLASFLAFEQAIIELNQKDMAGCEIKEKGLSADEDVENSPAEEHVADEFVLKRLLVHGEISNTYGAINVVRYGKLHVLCYSSSYATRQAYESLSQDPTLAVMIDKVESVEEYAEQDYDYTSYTNWGAQAADIGGYREFLVDNKVEKEVVVVVLDTGINTSHPMFENRLLKDSNGKIRGYSYYNSLYQYSYDNLAFDVDDENTTDVDEGDANKYSFEDDQGHGSHVAGIICDLTPSNVKILPIKISASNGYSSSSIMLNAYLRVIEIYSKQYNVVCTNLSFTGGGKGYESEKNLFNEQCYQPMMDINILPITAAGNEQAENNIEGLQAVVVSALTQEGNQYKFDNSYSNYGKLIDIAAPGTGINSAWIGETDGASDATHSAQGTSMASPQVAGVVALLYLNPNLDADFTASDIEQTLYDNCLDMGAVGQDKYYGHGMLHLKYFEVGSPSATLSVYRDGELVTEYIEYENFEEEMNLEITCSDAAFDIIYSTDKSIPTFSNSSIYSSAFLVDETIYLYAMGIKVEDGQIVERTNLFTISYFDLNTPLEDCFTISTSGDLETYTGHYSHLMIPSTLNGITVKRISPQLFRYSNIYSVELPSSCVSISGYAFYGCENLEYIYAPSVTTLFEAAFYNCRSLPAVYDCHPSEGDSVGAFFPNVTKTVGFTFSGCKRLERVSMTKLSDIGSSSGHDFQACTNLKEVYLPAITSIPKGTFKFCENLTGNFYINEHIESFGEEAFLSCKITSFQVHENNEYFYSDGLGVYSKGSLELFALGNPQINYSVLESVTINGTDYQITTISDHAMMGEVNFINLTIPASITTIGQFAFSQLQINTLFYNATNCSENGYCYYYGGELYIAAPFSQIDTIVIGEGVISPSGKNYFDEGESPIFTFAANTGHYVKRIVVDGEQLSEETLASAIENGYRFSAIDADHTIEVEFAATEYTITYKDANGDLLTDLQPTMYTYGVGATLPENIEKEGYVFGGWYASADYSGNPTTNISVSESGDKTYYAKFDEEITYTVTIEETEYGTVEPSGALTVQSGDDLELTFKPDDGYILSELVIDGEDVTHLVVDNKYTIENITKDYRVRAVFDKPMYTITATYDSNGTIEVNEGGTNSPAEEHYVYGGESLIFTFLPNVGCYVKSIVVDGEELTGTEFENALANGYTFANIDENHTISAVFEKYTYSITVIQTEHGVISPDSIAAIAYGENQTFTITPELGYLIERVIVDGVDLSSGEIEDAATNGYTFANIDENHTISATFKEDLTTPYTVKHWQESLVAERATLIEDKYYTLVATDASQKGMAGQLTSAAANDYEGFTAQTINQQTIASDGSSVVDVLYNRNTYLLTLATTDGIASVSGEGEYLFGQTVSVSATIEDEYNWTAWVSSDASKLADGESLEYSFTMPAAPITLTAEAALKQYTITFDDIIDGTVMVDGSAVTNEIEVNHGDDLELTFVPDEGFVLSELLVEGEDVTHLVVDNKFTLTNITADYRLSVIFNLPTYEITAQSNGLGTIDPEGLTTVFEGDEVVYTFTPDVGCKIKDVKVNGVSVGAVDSYTFTEIDSDCTIYVEFEKIKLSINVIAGDHGIVTPNGETIVEYGSDATFTIFAEANYGIEYIKVNGQYIDIKEMFTLRNITENTTIEIEFMKMYFTITATSGANGSITPSAAVKLGQQKRFDFIPNEGYKVKDVKVDNVSIGAVGQYTFVNVDSDHTISVEFEIQTFNVTVTSDGKGSLNTEQSLENVAYGENITFTISIAEEWELYKLYVNGESVDVENNILTIRVDKDTTIQAIFKEKTAEMNTIMIILIAAAAVVVIALATVLIVYHKKSKNRRKDGTPPDATTGGGEQGVKTIKTAHSAQPHPQAPKMPQEMDMSDTKLQMQQEEVVPGVQESQVEDQMLSQALQFAKGRQDHFIAFCARNKLDYQKDYNGAVKRYYQAYLRSRNKTKPPQG